MNQLPDDYEKLRAKELKLRRKLFLGKRKEANQKNEKNALIRQAQKWKLEAILQKKRTQEFVHILNGQRVRILEEKQNRRHAQAANNILRLRVHELRNVQRANKGLIKEARRWKQIANLAELKRFHEEKTPQVVREKEKLAEQVKDLEKKLKAAQRKLSLKESDRQKLINSKEELMERKIQMGLQKQLIHYMQTDMRLDVITLRKVIESSQENYARYRRATEENEEQGAWIERMRKEAEKLKGNLKEILSRGIDLKIQNSEMRDQIKMAQKENQELEKKAEEFEEKIKEKDEEIRYIEYLHDELYKSSSAVQILSLISLPIQIQSINSDNLRHVECEADAIIINCDNNN